GLDVVDRLILRRIIEQYDGGPVGIVTLAAATSEEADTIEDVYEPFLIKEGFLTKTPRGRVATRRAYEHLSIPYLERQAPPNQASLFDVDGQDDDAEDDGDPDDPKSHRNR
ncbi:MAG TPA: Holliday junction DNA helicase RuvB C-terminal domain-containing protein, partial [Thermomicrobiaceae bacterium]|nr:Holliday junction DNA helicase RuvB C-terminal domain-containing protein [Thermomicrobiaceae bacterium]